MRAGATAGGLDPETLANRVQSEVDAGRILGAALAVVGGRDLVLARGFGRTSVEPEGVPVTPTTLFAAASISKTVLATAVMRLVERGKLSLDVPVLSYLPSFRFSDQALGARVTLRHLLSHTSGLPTGGKDWGPPDRDALARFVHEQLSRYAFVAEPGRVHLYSNTAICLAGYVAEVVTRTPYRDLVGELVFEPLGMTRSTYDHAVAMTYRVALPHEDDGGQLRAVHRWPDNRSGDPAGFAIAPVADLAQLALVHLNGGRWNGRAFLSAASIREMHAVTGDRHVRAASHPVAHAWEGYGLGLMLGHYRGARLVRHGATLQSFAGTFDLLPDRRRAFVLLTNHCDDAGFTDCTFALRDLLLGLPEAGATARSVLLPVAEPAPDRDAWPAYEGTYLSVPLGRVVTIARAGGRLSLVDNRRTRRLTAVAPGAYFYEDETFRVPVEFLAPESGPVEHVFVGGNPYRRCAAEADTTDPTAWPGYVGEYVDPSNMGEGARWRVRLDGADLRIAGDWRDKRLVPFGRRSFLSGLGLVEFDIDGSELAIGGATRYVRAQATENRAV